MIMIIYNFEMQLNVISIGFRRKRNCHIKLSFSQKFILSFRY